MAIGCESLMPTSVLTLVRAGTTLVFSLAIINFYQYDNF